MQPGGRYSDVVVEKTLVGEKSVDDLTDADTRT
jgi:hypothetical protein